MVGVEVGEVEEVEGVEEVGVMGVGCSSSLVEVVTVVSVEVGGTVVIAVRVVVEEVVEEGVEGGVEGVRRGAALRPRVEAALTGVCELGITAARQDRYVELLLYICPSVSLSVCLSVRQSVSQSQSQHWISGVLEYCSHYSVNYFIHVLLSSFI